MRKIIIKTINNTDVEHYKHIENESCTIIEEESNTIVALQTRTFSFRRSGKCYCNELNTGNLN